jgi:hypothetical protein
MGRFEFVFFTQDKIKVISLGNIFISTVPVFIFDFQKGSIFLNLFLNYFLFFQVWGVCSTRELLCISRNKGMFSNRLAFQKSLDPASQTISSFLWSGERLARSSVLGWTTTHFRWAGLWGSLVSGQVGCLPSLATWSFFFLAIFAELKTWNVCLPSLAVAS